MPSVLTTGYHDTTVRVRYAETDKMGLAYNAHYLTWFEVGRTEFLRAIGQTYRETEISGFLLPLRSAEVQYLKPARYDDVLTIRSRIFSKPSVRLEIGYEIFTNNVLIATGYTEHAFTDDDLKPVKPPQKLRNDLINLWSLSKIYYEEQQ